jgi:hypothetical protein
VWQPSADRSIEDWLILQASVLDVALDAETVDTIVAQRALALCTDPPR